MTPRAKNDALPEEYVTIREWSRRTGETPQTVYSRKSQGVWISGKHFHQRGRMIRLNFHECNKWLKGK